MEMMISIIQFVIASIASLKILTLVVKREEEGEGVLAEQIDPMTTPLSAPTHTRRSTIVRYRPIFIVNGTIMIGLMGHKL